MAVHMQRSFLARSRPQIERFKFSRYESIDEIMTPPITPTTPISPKEYDILPATPEDKEEIINFLREFFFRDEPLNKCSRLISEESPVCADLENFSLAELDNGLNLKAVYNGKIIGVSLNSLIERGYLEKEDKHNVTDRKFSKIYRLLSQVAKESDVFAKFTDCDKGMTVKILSVNGAFRGQGIAKELMNKTRDMARNLGCGFMSVDCSSHFTALALKKLGFELHYTLKYSDFKEDGQVVFKPEPPHEACTVYVQEI